MNIFGQPRRGAWMRLRRSSMQLFQTCSELSLQLVVSPTFLSLTVLYSVDKLPTTSIVNIPQTETDVSAETEAAGGAERSRNEHNRNDLSRILCL